MEGNGESPTFSDIYIYLGLNQKRRKSLSRLEFQITFLWGNVDVFRFHKNCKTDIKSTQASIYKESKGQSYNPDLEVKLNSRH